MSVFDVLCNKASITHIEDNYENRLISIKEKYMKIIEDKEETIKKKKKRIDIIKQSIAKREEAIAKIKINLLSENE